MLQGAVEEMERKKEKILLASLRRRQAQEESKARKELAAAMAKEREQAREERVAMKREDDKARRAQILQQYKLKKAIEEAEREVTGICAWRVYEKIISFIVCANKSIVFILS